jgi:hypothetical protein
MSPDRKRSHLPGEQTQGAQLGKYPFAKFSSFLWAVSLVTSAAAVLVTYAVFSSAYYPAFMQDEWVGLGHYFNIGFWPSIFCQHNQHIVFVPKLLSRILYITTDANPLLRGLSSLLAATMSGLMLGLIAFGALRGHPWSSRLQQLSLSAVCVATLTWLVSYQQLFWGMATYTYFSIIFGVAALSIFSALDKRKGGGLALVIFPALLATLSTLSFSYGVASWGALAILMLFHRKNVWASATILALGLILFFSLRLTVPACDQLQMPVSTDLQFTPQIILMGLAATHGSIWTQGLAPLISPSITTAAIFGSAGLLILLLLTRSAFNSTNPGNYKLLVALCWFASGMLLLVSIGRSPYFIDYPNQMIAVRFLPLSIFFWACLIATACCRLCAISRHASHLAGILLACLSTFILLSTILTVPWLSTHRFGSGQYHFSFNELRLETIRTWISNDPIQRTQSALTLSFVNIDSFQDNVDEARSRNWDFFSSFPLENFPSRVSELQRDSGPPVNEAGQWMLQIDRVSKENQPTWTVYGSLPARFPQQVEHIFLAEQDNIIGYAVTSPFQAYTSTPRMALNGIGELPGRIFAGSERLRSLLQAHQSWMGVGISSTRPQPGSLECYQINKTTLVCN